MFCYEDFLFGIRKNGAWNTKIREHAEYQRFLLVRRAWNDPPKVNCLTNPFSQKNAIELFTLVLTNINRILQADPDLAMYNMQGTRLTDHETPIIRNSERSDIQLGFNNRNSQ